MKHRKVAGKAKCYCGSKMFIWKNSGWVCEKELMEEVGFATKVKKSNDIRSS